MDNIELELIDLGDVELVDLGNAKVETKQCLPQPAIWPDSWFQWGSQPYPWYPGQCG